MTYLDLLRKYFYVLTTKIFGQANRGNALHALLLTIVISAIIFTRFTHIWERTLWFDDSARDFMIAKKIAQSDKPALIAPKANMGLGILKNSYLYYNTLGLLWLIGGDELGLLRLYAGISTISLLCGYIIGKDIGGKWLGLICLISLSTVPSVMQHNITIYQRSFLPIGALIIMLFAIKVIKHKSFRYLFWLHAAMIVSLLFHYAIITLLPVVALLTLVVLKKHKTPLLKKLLIICCLVGIDIFIYLLLTGSNMMDFAVFFGKVASDGYDHTNVINFQDLHTIFNYIYPHTNFQSFIPFQCFFFLCFFGACYIIHHNKRLDELSILLLFLFTAFIFPLFTGHEIGHDYMRHYEVIGLLVSPIVSYWIVRRFLPTTLPWFVIIYLSILCIRQLPLMKEALSPTKYANETTDALHITNLAKADYLVKTKDESLAGFVIIDYTDWAAPGWFTPPFLFFLEKQTHRSYAELSTTDNNLRLTYNPNFSHVYLVCDELMEPAKVVKTCLEPFITFQLYKVGEFDENELRSELFMRADENVFGATVFRITRKLPVNDQLGS